jgi:hypothetical protein
MHMSSQRRRLRRTALLLPALAAALALGGCAGSGSNDSSTSAGEAPVPASDVKGVERGAADSTLSEVATDGDVFQAAPASGGKAARADYAQQAVISTGAVSLSSDDVGKARFDVQTVIDDHRGETSDEKTETGDDGKVTRARLVFRVPVSEFSDTMTALEDSATLLSSSRSSEDVTTQVIDTEVRIRAQEKSIERIEVLYARAQSIRDIMAIEAQLNRRQADLDSLKQQQAWLQSQTSMSTITVNLQVTPDKKATDKKKDESGFLAGLSAGWHGLKRVTSGAATALGAFLPFGVVILVLGLPLWFVARRLIAPRRGAPATLPASDPSPAES